MMLPSNNLASTSTSDTSSENKTNSYQVLNISNVNAQKEIVLNDEQLLGLIQLYPFLYNPHVKPYKDADFDSFAWEQITKAFNRTYESLERNVWYTTSELQARWNVLQPIVRSLSKISNIKSLPDSLRQTVIKMSVPMDEQNCSETSKKPLSVAQQIVNDNIKMVRRLPLVYRRKLEAEMMELILNCELDTKATIKHNVENQAEKEYKDFLKAAGLQEVTFADFQPQLIGLNTPTLSTIPTYNGGAPLTTVETGLSNVVKTEPEPDTDGYALLQPLPSKKWVPLSQWQNYVRKCRVRIKRSNLEAMMKEDEIPLARIKREKLGL